MRAAGQKRPMYDSTAYWVQLLTGIDIEREPRGALEIHLCFTEMDANSFASLICSTRNW
jgi:hypothetical protein